LNGEAAASAEGKSKQGYDQSSSSSGSSTASSRDGKSSRSSSSADVSSLDAAVVQFDEQAAAHQLFGPDLLSVLGVPRTRHYVCAVPDAAGGVAGLTYCLGPTAAAAAAAAAADSLADVLSSMKASMLTDAGCGR
jgi:hypothetical protein